MLENNITIPNRKLIDLYRKVKNNNVIAEHYVTLSNEFEHNKQLREDFLSKSSRILNCIKYWKIHDYEKQLTKDVQTVSYCHDKFCTNCQNKLSLKRFNVYTPILNDKEKDFDIYHVVFTIKNPKFGELKPALDKMYKKFGYIAGYLNGSRKVTGLDLNKYGFGGGIKSLEITINNKKEFHPHFHCLLLFKKNLLFDKTIRNGFSTSKANGKRLFSEFEILLQRIWYLVYNEIEVNQFNLDNINLVKKYIGDYEDESKINCDGYSVIMDKISNVEDKNFKEVFKYTLKSDFKQIANNYEIFKELFFALKGRQTLQTYGDIKEFTDKELNEIIDKETDKEYTNTLLELSNVESCKKNYYTVKQVKNDASTGKYTFISRNSILKDVVGRFKDK